MKIDHTSKDDLKQLETRLARLPEEARREILCQAVADGLFRISAPDAGIDLVGSFLSDLPRQACVQAVGAVFSQIENLFELTWKAFLEHLVNGFDQFDLASAGGYCADELKTIAAYIAPFGITMEIADVAGMPTGVIHPSESVEPSGNFDLAISSSGVRAVDMKTNS